MFSSESGRDGSLLVGIVEGDLSVEEVLQSHESAANEFGHEGQISGLVQSVTHSLTSDQFRSVYTIALPDISNDQCDNVDLSIEDYSRTAIRVISDCDLQNATLFCGNSNRSKSTFVLALVQSISLKGMSPIGGPGCGVLVLWSVGVCFKGGLGVMNSPLANGEGTPMGEGAGVW